MDCVLCLHILQIGKKKKKNTRRGEKKTHLSGYCTLYRVFMRVCVCKSSEIIVTARVDYSATRILSTLLCLEDIGGTQELKSVNLHMAGVTYKMRINHCASSGHSCFEFLLTAGYLRCVCVLWMDFIHIGEHRLFKIFSSLLLVFFFLFLFFVWRNLFSSAAWYRFWENSPVNTRTSQLNERVKR